jgi:hypothetical protein
MAKPRISPIQRRLAAAAHYDTQGMDPEMVQTLSAEAARRVSAPASTTKAPATDWIGKAVAALKTHFHGTPAPAPTVASDRPSQAEVENGRAIVDAMLAQQRRKGR